MVEITNLTSKDLFGLASLVVDSVTTKNENGYKVVNRINLKPTADIVLWMALNHDNEYKKETPIEDLYWDLKEKGELNFGFSDKYDEYYSFIYNLITDIETENEAMRVGLDNEIVNRLSIISNGFHDIKDAFKELNFEGLTDYVDNSAEKIINSIMNVKE